MAQDASNARKRAVVPGKAILGEAGAALANKKSIGGAVVPGRAVLGDEGAAAEAEKVRAARAAAKVAADAKAKKGPAVRPVKSEGIDPREPKDPVVPDPVPPAGMSEAEAVEMIDKDPNAWETVLEQEGGRPDGIRIGIAKAIVEAAPHATKPKVPGRVLSVLKAQLAEAVEEEG